MYILFCLFLFFSAYDNNLEISSSSFPKFLLKTTIFNTIKHRIICSFLKSQDIFEIKTSAC